MSGVSDLAAGYDLLEITYREVEGGAALSYRTDNGPLIGALHDWFDAQGFHPGTDAMPEPVGHAMTEEMRERHHPGQPYPGATHDDYAWRVTSYLFNTSG